MCFNKTALSEEVKRMEGFYGCAHSFVFCLVFFPVFMCTAVLASDLKKKLGKLERKANMSTIVMSCFNTSQLLYLLPSD